MTVKEFFDEIHEDYGEVIERIGNEAWIVKYLKKFSNDGCFATLKFAIAAKDWEEGFKMSHSLKGLALNLGLTNLSKVSSALCETMRHGAPTVDVTGLYNDVEAEYEKVINAIGRIDG